jgi:hypothetical protein
VEEGHAGRQERTGAVGDEYPLKEIFVAAAIQGAIYAVVRTAVDRQGARLYQRWTGEWPGN